MLRINDQKLAQIIIINPIKKVENLINKMSEGRKTNVKKTFRFPKLSPVEFKKKIVDI